MGPKYGGDFLFGEVDGRAIQAVDDFVDLERCLPVGRVDVAVEPAMRDDLDGVVDVVEHDHRVAEEEDCLGDAEDVGFRGDDARLEVANSVVGDVADCAPGEGRDAGDRNRLKRAISCSSGKSGSPSYSWPGPVFKTR